MAIVRLLNEALLEVRENGEEVADKISENGGSSV